jgi:riboflavin biosynthesis pyrimidine reductase
VDTIEAPDFTAALKELKARGCQSILIEGGGDFAATLLNENLVDRVYWIQAPLFLRDGIRGFGAGTGITPGDAERWCVVERRTLDEDTLLVMEKGSCSPVS